MRSSTSALHFAQNFYDGAHNRKPRSLHQHTDIQQILREDSPESVILVRPEEIIERKCCVIRVRDRVPRLVPTSSNIRPRARCGHSWLLEKRGVESRGIIFDIRTSRRPGYPTLGRPEELRPPSVERDLITGTLRCTTTLSEAVQ